MINRVVVLGGGSAGFLAALTLKTRISDLQVVVLRSKEIGIIGVGEGTTVDVPKHLHAYLKLDTAEFYRRAQPIWKLGIRFLWGSRPWFDYAFGFQYHSRYVALPKHVGYYADDDLTDVGITTALMTREMAFAREANELPSFGRHFGYHFENEKLCAYLEWEATRRGVEVREGTVVEVRQDERGITGLLLDGGELVTADLYLDSSGFRSELLGRALGEPFVDFKRSLFCDRAVVGGWDRVPGEALHPYTTAETMDHGWCWRIDHEHRINRGYVYSSAFAPDDQAEREFREKNPRVATTRIVKFPTGRYQRAWVKNVVSVGNASGFVEPLESTSLAAICVAAQNLAEMLVDCDRQARPTTRSLYNRRTAQGWDNIRRFLAVHYKYNTRLETQFWRACRADVDLAGAEPIVEFYQENGPTPIWNQTLLEPTDQFGAEGYMAMFIGQHLPYQKTYQPGAPELETWGRIRRGIGGKADAGVSTVEALAHIRAPSWVWSPQFFQ